MERHSPFSGSDGANHSKGGINTEILDDLKRKQEVLAAACRCLDDHEYYMFFDHLAALSEESEAQKERLLDALETLGDYDEGECAVIRRLVTQGGAVAFKELVDMVREIRIQREIGVMLA